MTDGLLREAIRLIVEGDFERIQYKNSRTGGFEGGSIDVVDAANVVPAGDGTATYKGRDVLIVTPEVLARYKAKEEHLRSVARKPYLRGQWEKVPRDYSDRDDRGDHWVADDPRYGKVYLSLSSDTTYKKTGPGNRLRDPGGTRYSWRAILGPAPRGYASDGSVDVFKISTTGEGRDYDKQSQVRERMVKQFGIDPYPYAGALKQKEKEQPSPAWAAPSRRMAQDAVKSGAVFTGDAAPSAAPGGKTYKVYGRLKGAPAHTRLKGKAYLAPADTGFKPGEQVSIEPQDGKLSVRDVASDRTQTWEPEE